jgi:membrane associated rhomboid family serine protease
LVRIHRDIIDFQPKLIHFYILIAAMGGIFTLGECAAKGIREEDDAINAAIGGCAAGLLAGIKSKYLRIKKRVSVLNEENDRPFIC